MAFRGNWKLSPLIVLLTGCAANAGLVGTRTIGADPTVSRTGASVSGLLQPSRDHGFAFGGELRTSCRVNHDDDVGPDDGALRGLVGYSSAPLPHRASPVGVDALLAVGFGSQPYDGGTTRALSGGPHLGLPIRLVKGREMWDAEQKVGLTSMIVPSLDWTLYVPVGEGVSHSVRHEATLGVAYRAHLWSALVP